MDRYQVVLHFVLLLNGGLSLWSEWSGCYVEVTSFEHELALIQHLCMEENIVKVFQLSKKIVALCVLQVGIYKLLCCRKLKCD